MLVKENKQRTLQRCRKPAIVYSPESLKNSELGLKTRQTLWSVSSPNQELKNKLTFLKKGRKQSRRKCVRLQQFEACYPPFMPTDLTGIQTLA